MMSFLFCPFELLLYIYNIASIQAKCQGFFEDIFTSIHAILKE